MYPVLARFPWSQWALPWSWPLGALVGLGAAALLWGLRTRGRGWCVLGGGVLLVGGGLGWVLRGQEYVAEPFFVPSWGALLALSGVIGWLVTLRRASARGLAREQAEPVLAWAALGALGGARVAYGLGAGESLGALFALSAGGLSGVGALWGGLGAAAWAVRRGGVDFLRWLDAMAPTLAFTVVAVRAGCFLQGCDFGPPLGAGSPHMLQVLGTVPRWAPETSELLGPGPPLLLDQEALGLLSRGAMASLPAHPTPLYEALGAALLLGFVLWWEGRAPVRGAVGCVVLAGYAGWVVLLAPWRDDPHLGPAALAPWVLLAVASGAWGIGRARAELRATRVTNA
jgi:prolipoprotein diacylglyceryltransferase